MAAEQLTVQKHGIYIDGDFASEPLTKDNSPASAPEFSSPIPARTDPDIFSIEVTQSLEKFKPCPLNTPFKTGSLPYLPIQGMGADLGRFILVAESPLKPMGAGIVKWTRTYAKVPDSYFDYESYSYSFIGYSVISSKDGKTATPSRERQNRVVTSQVFHEFFATGPSLGGGPTYRTPGDIPAIEAQKYFGSSGFDTNYLYNAGRVGNVSWGSSSPALDTYLGWVSSASSGFSNGTKLVAEDSRLTRWRGNIFLRQTRYVLPQ